MIDYSKGKVYAIRFKDDKNALYIGSTTMDLSARFQRHKYDVDCSLYKYVQSHYNGDWKKCYIDLIENADCKSRKELDKLEGAKMKELIGNHYKLINRSIAGRTHKEYYIDNADKRREYQRIYDAKHRKKMI